MKALPSDLAQHREHILQIAARYGASDIRIFGSRVRGDATPSSDLDILVTLAPGRSLIDLIAIKQDLEDLLGWPVDVVTEAAISPYIRDDIIREAVAL